MPLLDLQGLEPPAPEGHGGDSTLSVTLCDCDSTLSVLLCQQD